MNPTLSEPMQEIDTDVEYEYIAMTARASSIFIILLRKYAGKKF